MWDLIAQLYGDLLADNVGDAERDLLTPVAARLSAFAPSFARYRSLDTAPPPAPADDLWTWYALSRLHDLLVLGRQPPPGGDDQLSD